MLEAVQVLEVDHHRGPVGAMVGPFGGVGLGAEDRAVPRGPRPEVVKRPGPVLPGDLVREVGNVREDLGSELGALRERPSEPRRVSAGDDQSGNSWGRIGHRQIQAHDLAPNGAQDLPERRHPDPARVVDADRSVGRLDVNELVDPVDRRGTAGGERRPRDRRDHRRRRPKRAGGRSPPERRQVGQEPPAEPGTQDTHRAAIEAEEQDPRRQSRHARVASWSSRPPVPIPRRSRQPWRQERLRKTGPDVGSSASYSLGPFGSIPSFSSSSVANSADPRVVADSRSGPELMPI